MNPLDVYMGFMVPIVMKLNTVVLKEMTLIFPEMATDVSEQRVITSSLKREAVCFSKTLVSIYQITRRSLPKVLFKILGTNTFFVSNNFSSLNFRIGPPSEVWSSKLIDEIRNFENFARILR